MGAVVGRGQRRAVAAAARPHARRGARSPTAASRRPSDDDVLDVVPALAGGRAARSSRSPRSPSPRRAVARRSRPRASACAASTAQVDVAWRRTSYSGLIRAAEQSRAASASEPEVTGARRRGRGAARRRRRGRADRAATLPSPMADLPAGRDLRVAGARACSSTPTRSRADLRAELRDPGRASSWRWWPVDVTPTSSPTALVPLHDTPLGPLAPGLTLGRDRPARPAPRARLRDPAGRRRPRGRRPTSGWPTSAPLLRRHLPADDPLRAVRRPAARAAGARRPVAARLPVRLDRRGAAGARTATGHRYLVVDYKTNRLGDPDQPLTAADYARDRLAEAMLHSDYPLQALLYVVVLHRYLRWRLPGYDPAQHLGGVLYLYLRGMCGAETPGGRRPPRRGLQLAAAGGAGRRAVRPARRTARRTTRSSRSRPRTRTTARLALGRRRAAADLQRGRRARGGRRARRAAAVAALGRGARRAASRSPWRSPCARSAAARSASTWPRSPTDAGSTSLPWPEPDGVARRAARQPAGRHARGAAAARDDRLLYLDRYWREEEQVRADLRRPAGAGAARARRDAPRWTRRSTGSSGRGVRRAAGRGRGSRCPSGPPCSPAGPAPARPPRSPRCSPCSPSRRSTPAAPRSASR